MLSRSEPRHTAVNWLGGAALFLIVAVPSLKLVLFSHEIWNLVPVFFVLGGLLALRDVPLSESKLNALAPFAVYFLLLVLAGVLNPGAMPNLVELGKYLVLIVLTVTVPLVSNDAAVRIGVRLMFWWFLVVAVYQFAFRIPLTGGFQYLSVGLPVGLMTLIAFARFVDELRFPSKLAYLAAIIFGFLTLMTMPGRTPLAVPLVVIVGFYLVEAYRQRTPRSIMTAAAVLFLSVFATLIVYHYMMSAYQQQRFARLFDPTYVEPRTAGVYHQATEAIIRNPFGYGLGASWNIIGYHPHNIFLETMISCGVVGLLALLWVTVAYLRASWFFLMNWRRSQPWILATVFMTFFHFVLWNLSYDIASAYGLLPLMALVVYRAAEIKRQQGYSPNRKGADMRRRLLRQNHAG